MDNPVAEIEDVVRSITEPADASIIVKNVGKYFTKDAQIFHPLFNQPYSKEHGLEELKGLYSMLRFGSKRGKIDFNSVMFNEDMTRGFIDLFETGEKRHATPINSARFLVIIYLRKCEDGKYRIYRQDDNFPSDLTISGFSKMLPGLTTFNDYFKGTAGFIAAKLGSFLLARGWLGP
ncbi:hypothetical protein DFH28DRAFT_452496 [Melampsora americana]|nr:hypothetical protein DFH28DRAFT_452496 [Melampsora americana]